MNKFMKKLLIIAMIKARVKFNNGNVTYYIFNSEYLIQKKFKNWNRINEIYVRAKRLLIKNYQVQKKH